MDSEVDQLPGGRLGLILILLGGSIVAVSLLLWLLSLGSPSSIQIGSEAWIVPAIGVTAIGAALALRRSQSLIMRSIGYAALVICTLLFLVVLFGTHPVIK